MVNNLLSYSSLQTLKFGFVSFLVQINSIQNCIKWCQLKVYLSTFYSH